MKTKQILKQTACAAIAVVLLCGCNHSPSIDNETRNTDTTQDTSTVLAPETSTVTENTVTTAAYDPFREWYLAEVDRKTYPEDNYRVQADEKHRDWVIQTPKQSTVQIGDVVFTVDFFKEIYHFGEGLQVRVTALNTGADAFTYVQRGLDCHVVCDESKKMIAWTFFRKEHLIYIQEDIQYKTIAPNESVVYEYFFLIDSTRFETAGKYTFSCATVAGNIVNGVEQEYIVEIPLEVIAG